MAFLFKCNACSFVHNSKQELNDEKCCCKCGSEKIEKFWNFSLIEDKKEFDDEETEDFNNTLSISSSQDYLRNLLWDSPWDSL